MVISNFPCIPIFSYARFHAYSDCTIVSSRMEECSQNIFPHIELWVHSPRLDFFWFCDTSDWYWPSYDARSWYFNPSSPAFKHKISLFHNFICFESTLCLFSPSFKQMSPVVSVGEFSFLFQTNKILLFKITSDMAF